MAKRIPGSHFPIGTISPGFRRVPDYTDVARDHRVKSDIISRTKANLLALGTAAVVGGFSYGAQKLFGQGEGIVGSSARRPSRTTASAPGYSFVSRYHSQHYRPSSRGLPARSTSSRYARSRTGGTQRGFLRGRKYPRYKTRSYWDR